MLNRSSDSIQPDVRFMVKLFCEKCVHTTIGRIPFLKDLKLQEGLSCSPFNLYLRMPDSFDKSDLEVDLKKL